MRLLARRRHFRAELGRKLGDRGYEAAAVEETLDRLTDHGYVDDLEAAREYVRVGRRRRRWGRTRLRAELARRGVDKETAAAALASIGDDEELALAREIAAGRRLGRDALARHLARKGFPSGVIVAILEEVADD